MIFDMHCHTKEGSPDAKLPIEQYIQILIQKGFSGMLVSDHDSYKGYKAYLKQGLDKKYPDFHVLQGIEYDTLDAGHILCILPDNVNLRILEIKSMPVKLLVDIVHHHGGILGPAHPYGIRHQSVINTVKQHKQMAVMKHFDFVESFNACESEENNSKAADLAATYGIPGFAGSDAHKAKCAGLARTEFPDNVLIECNNDLIKYIHRGGQGIKAGGDYYTGTVKNKIGFLYTGPLMSLYFIYNKTGGAINKLRHNRKLRDMYLTEMREKVHNIKNK